MDIKQFFKDNHELSDRINWRLEIQVCMSGAGYYIGMLDTDGAPYCRLSQQYWRTAAEAKKALDEFDFMPRLWA